MKKTYTTPKVEVLGTVESLTQAFGDPGANDVIYLTLGGPVLGSGKGSTDGYVVPVP